MSAGPRSRHAWIELSRHENFDRIRVEWKCVVCAARRFGCYAKRLDAEGVELWGPVGAWTYSTVQEGCTA